MNNKTCLLALRCLGKLSTVAISLFLYYSIVTANAVFVHYKVMYDEALSISTRLIDRIETLDGFTGDETVILYGAIQNSPYFEANVATQSELLNRFTGPHNSNNINAVNWNGPLKRYIKNILNFPMDVYYDKEQIEYVEERINTINLMRSFPANGSVLKDGDYIIVKLSDEGDY